jgi:hypothetical protein
MKCADIKIGEDYAVEDYRDHYYRATVLAVGRHSRRVYSGARWDFGGHIVTNKMVQVRPVVSDTQPPPSGPVWVMPAKVVRPWAEQAPIIDQAKAARAAKTNEKAARQERLDAINAAMGWSANRLLLSGKHAIGAYVSLEQLEQLFVGGMSQSS